MKKNIVGIAVLLFTLVACQNIPENASEITQKQQNGFLTYTGSFSNDKVALTSVTYANQSSGEVLVEFNLLNKTDKELIVKYLLTELATLEGLRSSPEYVEDFPNVLKSGEEVRYSLKYLPTNSRHLITEIGYRGDLEAQYELDLEFIGLKGEKLALTSNEEDYANYLNNFGQEKGIRIYKVTNKSEWLKEQSACTKKPDDKLRPSSVGMYDREVLIKGIVCKMALYQSTEALHLRIRMANQSEQLVNVIPEQLMLKLENQQVELDSVEVLSSNRKNAKGKGLVLRKGERYQVDYTFKLVKEGALEMSSLGVFLEENAEEPLLCFPLQFAIPES